MTAQVKSERLVFRARPRFEIDGQSELRLNEDLIRLETHQNEDGLARLEAVFKNWGRVSENSGTGFVYFDGEILELGREIKVFAGEVDNEANIFRGIITAIDGVYPESRAPEVVLRAEDKLQWLRMTQRTRLFSEFTDTDIARDVADSSGFSSDAQAEGPSHTELLQLNQNDLSLLRERARAVDARLQEQDGVLLFRPRREDQPEPIQLTRKNELINIQVCADLAYQRAAVRVHGYSVADKTGIHETADASDVRNEADNSGRTGPEIIEDLQPNAIEYLHLEAPATSEEARTLAQARLRRRARRFITARATTSATPGLQAGSKVDFVDLGAWFSGIYHITQIRHTFDMRDGLRSHFYAERVDLGDSI